MQNLKHLTTSILFKKPFAEAVTCSLVENSGPPMTFEESVEAMIRLLEEERSGKPDEKKDNKAKSTKNTTHRNKHNLVLKRSVSEVKTQLEQRNKDSLSSPVSPGIAPTFEINPGVVC